MKKLITALIASGLVTAASAADLTVSYNRDTTDKSNGGGLSVGTSFKGIGVSASVDRYTKNKIDTDVYGASVSYEVLKVLGVGINPLLGVSYITQEKGKSGFAAVGGVSFVSSLTKNVALVTEVTRTKGERSIDALNATVVSLGIRTSF